MIYGIIAAYLTVTLAIGVLGYRRGTPTADDYFLADRRIGGFVLFFTLIATNFSAFFFLGFAGAGYRVGYSYYGIMAFGTALVGVAFYVIGGRVRRLGRRHGYITPPELIGHQTGSPTLKLLFLTVMVVFTVPYLALQPIGAGYLLSQISHGTIPQFAGAVGLTAFMVAYVFLGGMRSVALTDVVQGVMMFALMLAAVLVLGAALGGIREANLAAQSQMPELFSRTGRGGFFTPRIWFSYMVLWVVAVPMFPQVFTRFFVPRSPRALRASATLYPIVTATLFLGPIMIGVWGHLRFPGLEGIAADRILPMMMTELAPDWLTGLVMVGALAAFMSTMDSQLLALSSILTRDVYTRFTRRDVSTAEQVRVGRALTVVLAILGLAIAYHPPATFVAIVTQAFTGLAVLAPTTLAVLYWPRTTAWGCVASILIGEGLLLGSRLQLLPPGWSMGFLPLVPILTLCTATILLTGRRHPAREPR